VLSFEDVSGYGVRGGRTKYALSWLFLVPARELDLDVSLGKVAILQDFVNSGTQTLALSIPDSEHLHQTRWFGVGQKVDGWWCQD
jgi:hypothetical protein